VAKAIGKPVCTVKQASAKRVKKGRLRRAGPRKGGRWEVMSFVPQGRQGGVTPQNGGTRGKSS